MQANGVSEPVTPDDLARRALRALRAVSRPGKAGDSLRIVLLLGRDASAARRSEFSSAVREVLAEDPKLGDTRVAVLRSKARAESRVEIEHFARAPRIQPRDRDILGLLGAARYLSTVQIASLFFDVRDKATPGRRLRKLARARGGGYVKVEYYPGLEGERVQVWSLTHAGYEVAEMAAPVPMNYSTEPVRPPFLEHLIWLNELLVALALTSGVPIRPSEMPFHWQYGQKEPLSFRSRGPDGTPTLKQVIPDAIIDLPKARRRIFVEAERGTHTIVPTDPSRAGATVVKYERYEAFFGDVIDAPAQSTAYRTHFPDGLHPELLFMVRTATRRDRIRRAIEDRRSRDPGPPAFDVEVLTVGEAVERYRSLLGPRCPPAGREGRMEPGRMGLGEVELTTLRVAFNALLRNAKAAQAAGLGALTKTEVDLVSEARLMLSRFEGGDGTWPEP